MRASLPWQWRLWRGGSATAPTHSNNLYAICGGRIVTPLEVHNPGTLLMRSGVILWVGPSKDVHVPHNATLVDARGQTVAPGFIDVHVHGAGGMLLASASSAADISRVTDYLQRSGTTSFFATIGSLGTMARQDMISSLRCCAGATSDRDSDTQRTGAEMIGIHLEGPFLSKDKAGVSKAFAGDGDYVIGPEIALEMLEAADGLVRLAVVAPELGCAEKVTRIYRENGVVVSLGHTDASYDLAKEAIVRWGMSHATHTFNAMRGLHHREPGAVGATLTSRSVVNEIIADGVHVHPAALQVVLRTKPREKVVLVTDGSGLSGMPDGQYRLPGTNVDVVVNGSRCALLDGTIAGSVTPMNFQMRFLASTCDLPLSHIIQLATLNPALEFGLSDRGLLAPGRNADVVVMDDDFTIKAVFQRGSPRFF